MKARHTIYHCGLITSDICTRIRLLIGFVSRLHRKTEYIISFDLNKINASPHSTKAVRKKEVEKKSKKYNVVIL